MSTYTGVARGRYRSSHTPGLTSASADQGVATGDVSVGRDSVIIKPISVPRSALPNRAPILYTVAQGDTLESIGKQFKLPWRDIVWSHPGLRLPLKVGRPIQLPPLPGVLVLL